MTVARIIAGLCALLLGRRLFWLFVGVLGFVLGSEVAGQLSWGAPEPVVLGTAVLSGIIGAVLAYILYEVMIGVAGFVAGSYLGMQLLIAVTPYPGRNLWIAALIGGFAGVILLNALFSWALIVISSLLGASLIVDTPHMSPSARQLAFLALVTIGIAAQARLGQRRRSVTS